MQGEMADLLGAVAGERTEQRRGYRAGYYSRGLITRVGKIELRVPRDRNGEFSTALFERFQRSEKALTGAIGLPTFVANLVQGEWTAVLPDYTEYDTVTCREVFICSFRETLVVLGAEPKDVAAFEFNLKRAVY